MGESLTDGFKSVAHNSPMLSLPNTYSDEEISDFTKRAEKNLDGAKPEYCLELKMDGTAISVILEHWGFHLPRLTSSRVSPWITFSIRAL